MEEQIKKIKRNNKIRISIIIVVFVLLGISINAYNQNYITSNLTENYLYGTMFGIAVILVLLSVPLIYITEMAYIKITKLNKSLTQKNIEKQRQKEEIENKTKETCKYCGCKIKEDVCQNCGAKRTE